MSHVATQWICRHGITNEIAQMGCRLGCNRTQHPHKLISFVKPEPELVVGFNPEIWEASPTRYYQDGTMSVGHSVIVDANRATQVNGAMCGLIALFDADPRWIHNNTSASSPWALFEYLKQLGWTFPPGSMLEYENFQSIASILDCKIRVVYVGTQLEQTCGEGHTLTLHLLNSHFLNGDEL